MNTTFRFDSPADSLAVELRQDVLEQRSRGHHIPDPDWSHVDPAGHEHRFVDGELPTLEWVVTGSWWCDSCRDEHEAGEYRCRECGAVVEPHYGWSGEQSFQVPGLQEAFVTETAGHVVRTWMLRGDEILALTAPVIAAEPKTIRREVERRAREIIARRDPDEWKVVA